MKEILQALSSIAASRNYASSLAGAITVMVALGAVDHDTANAMVAAFQQMMDGLGMMVGGAKKLYLLAAPIAITVIAKYAGSAGSLKNRLISLTTDKRVEIQGQIVVPAEIAAAVPSKQVVADQNPPSVATAQQAAGR